MGGPSRKLGVAMNTAQMRVQAAVDKGLLEMTGKPFSPKGRLTEDALGLLE